MFRLSLLPSIVFFLLIIVCSPRLGLAEPPEKNERFPLIIMGGYWTAHYKPENSDLSRVCDIGFTHVFSYYNELDIKSNINTERAVGNAEEFSLTVKNSCPSLRIAMGIPRRWIYEGWIDFIKSYVMELKERSITVDYWLADEIIHEMTSTGITLEEAKGKAQATINTVKEASEAAYIWIEPGNYNPHFGTILDVLNDLPADIKAYDEYVVSRTGRQLAESQSEFNSVLETLRRLKRKGNKVFPVCEINYLRKKDIKPTEEEIAAISIALLMEGADGLIFYEERWTTPEILLSLKKIISLIEYLNGVGVAGFVRTEDTFFSWESKNNEVITRVIINTLGTDIGLAGLLPANPVVVWPNTEKRDQLKPMELLVYWHKRF